MSQEREDRYNRKAFRGNSKGHSLSLNDSRNEKFGKSKSISQDGKNVLKFETRNTHQNYSRLQLYL